jgi:hypothetical protein
VHSLKYKRKIAGRSNEMRNIKKVALILFMIVFSCSLAYGGSGSPQVSDTGTPPNGMAYGSAAAGTKLTGVICIEYYNVSFNTDDPFDDTADAKIVLRLRKGSVLKVLYGTADAVLFNNIASNQMAIAAAMGPQILEVFFNNDQNLKVVLKSAEEFAQVDVFSPAFAFYAMFDVQLVVK